MIKYDKLSISNPAATARAKAPALYVILFCGFPALSAVELYKT
jgi:hypothetical protein